MWSKSSIIKADWDFDRCSFHTYTLIKGASLFQEKCLFDGRKCLFDVWLRAVFKHFCNFLEQFHIHSDFTERSASCAEVGESAEFETLYQVLYLFFTLSVTLLVQIKFNTTSNFEQSASNAFIPDISKLFPLPPHSDLNRPNVNTFTFLFSHKKTLTVRESFIVEWSKTNKHVLWFHKVITAGANVRAIHRYIKFNLS